MPLPIKHYIPGFNPARSEDLLAEHFYEEDPKLSRKQALKKAKEVTWSVIRLTAIAVAIARKEWKKSQG